MGVSKSVQQVVGRNLGVGGDFKVGDITQEIRDTSPIQSTQKIDEEDEPKEMNPKK
jgi:hypothetical protein